MTIENVPRVLKSALESNMHTSPGSLLTLYETCEDILKENYPINLNGNEYLASRLSCKIKIEENIFEARIAREPQSKNITYLIYNKGQLPEETKNTHLLKLIAPSKKGGHPVLCFDEIDLSSGVNNPEDYEVAFSIAAKLRREKIDLQNRKKADTRARRQEIYSDIKKVPKYIGITALTISGLFYHTLTGEPDAHIGPVPMPSPVEWTVDLFKVDAHRAQGFKPPKNIEPLSQSELNAPIQINSGYSTNGSKTLEYDTYEEILSAGPGLHKIDLSEDEGNEKIVNEEIFDENYNSIKDVVSNCDESGKVCIDKVKDSIEELENSSLRTCKIVHAEVDSKMLRVFAKDKNLINKLEISTSADKVEICPKSGTLLPEASIYIHQDAGR